VLDHTTQQIFFFFLSIHLPNVFYKNLEDSERIFFIWYSILTKRKVVCPNFSFFLFLQSAKNILFALSFFHHIFKNTLSHSFVDTYLML